jgi:hypothetical protein
LLLQLGDGFLVITRLMVEDF